MKRIVIILSCLFLIAAAAFVSVKVLSSQEYSSIFDIGVEVYADGENPREYFQDFGKIADNYWDYYCRRSYTSEHCRRYVILVEY